MSLRFKLLLLGLLTLLLPWAGCQYAREMEGVMRTGERQSLSAVASTLAASLQGRTDLLYRVEDSDASKAAGPNDLQAVLLPSAPVLDGYTDEWLAGSPALRTFSSPPDSLRLLAGTHDRMLYLLLDVRDAHVVFDAPEGNPVDPDAAGDRVWVAFEDADGITNQVFIATSGAGPVRARRIEERELGRKVAVDEPRIEGVWQNTPGGYRVEVRIPLAMLGGHLGVLVDDRETRGGVAKSYGSLAPDDLEAKGRLIAASPDLAPYLDRFRQPGLRIAVDASGGGALAAADSLADPGAVAPQRGVLAMLYRRVLERAEGTQALEAEASIFDARHAAPIGTIRTSERGDLWLTLRDHAIERLMNLTFGISAFAVLAMGLFATRLAVRLSRLRRASETALTRDKLNISFPETKAPDELGDVARSFETLLGRIHDYTSYLRTLAGKLAHEIRTPLAIVRSSIENLESDPAGASATSYIERAREGADRLNTILIAMSAATRVEEAITAAERERFNLTDLTRSAAEAYRLAFPARSFGVDVPQDPVTIDGAPDLISQLLDKLVDNAVDFSPPGATITLRVRDEARAVVIEVDNPGPPIAAESSARLFESLWQSRTTHDNRPHFGLGLYIVKLIAAYHGGEATAETLPDAAGARFRITLPKSAPASLSR